MICYHCGYVPCSERIHWAPTLIDFLRSMTELGNGTLAKNIDQSNARLLGSINSNKFDFVPFEAGYLNIWWYLRWMSDFFDCAPLRSLGFDSFENRTQANSLTYFLVRLCSIIGLTEPNRSITFHYVRIKFDYRAFRFVRGWTTLVPARPGLPMNILVWSLFLLRNGPAENDSNNGNEHVGMLKRC